jgi:hypothetical protein
MPLKETAMTTLTRNQFVDQLANKTVDTAALKRAGANDLARADVNGDGKIAGAQEARALFDAIDRLDTNGTYASVDTSNMRVQSALDSVTNAGGPKPARGLSGKTMTRADVNDVFKDANVDAAELARIAERMTGDARLVNDIKGADLDGDGKIGGANEANMLFDAIERRDRDGSRNTVRVRQDGELDELLARAEQSMPASPERDARLAPDGGQRARIDDGERFGRRYHGSGPVTLSKDGGAFQFTGGMNVDTDGGTSKLSKSDRYYQSQTSMQWKGGKSLDADNLPFVVLPPSLAKATGAKLGDLVEVQQGDKRIYAIFGDVGPSGKLGEASLAAAKHFDAKAGPNRAVSGNVTYTVLPGSGAANGIKNGGPQKSWNDIQEAGARAFADARERGSVQ